MGEIKEITVVTEVGVKTYTATDNTKIICADYHWCGDSFPCFHVLVDGKLKHELRLRENITIEY